MKLYRCLGDGQFHKCESKPDVCPGCERNTLPTTIRQMPKLRVVASSQMWLEPYGWVEYASLESEDFYARKS